MSLCRRLALVIVLCGLVSSLVAACLPRPAQPATPTAGPASPAAASSLPGESPTPLVRVTEAPPTDTPPVVTPTSEPPTATPSVVPPAPTSDATPTPLGPTSLGRVENFAVVGRHDLGRRGWHGAVALALPCAYVGNRRAPQVTIVDVADPAAPQLAGALTLAPGSQPVELRAVPDLGLLVVVNLQPSATIQTYDVSDCRQPRPLGSLSLGALPHEAFLWRDPRQPERLLLYVAMWEYQRPDLHVVDLTDPANPRWLGAWNALADGAAGTLHSLSVSPDGGLAYLALWGGGLLLADVSDFALGVPEPRLRPLRAEEGLAPAPGQAVHSAVTLADPRFILITEEVYTCPFGALAIADAADPTRPHIVGRFALPENAPGCPGLPQPDAVFTAHNPLVVGSLAFVTWYAGGLQVLDVSDPAHPRRVAQYVPDGTGAAGYSYVGSYPVQMWSYPVLHDGLLYVADIESGLHILRYFGPGAEDVNAVPHAEGNFTVLPAGGRP